jgi:hypothetical protein
MALSIKLTRCGRHLALAFCTAIAMAATGSSIAAFPDAFNGPPSSWTGPVFKLSQSYPAAQPALEPLSKRKWHSFDFKNATQAPKYLQAVLDYCLEGNTANSFADVGQNTVRKWYHAPWLHTTASGREFIHGMTGERPSKMVPLPELGPAQSGPHDNWAVGFYNARGGYTIGQVWKDPLHPDPRKAKFPSDTVTCKLIFTTAPVSEAPYLQDSLEWQGDLNHSTAPGTRPTLRLLQVDVAVKDSRASSTIGWVFGTFQYVKSSSSSANWWDHLVPVGLMWGNDPVHTNANQPSVQQWINTTRPSALHLGFRGLLNGPIDNPLASCTGCHGRAQINRINGPTPSLPSAPSSANPSAAVIKRYFTNIKSGQALSADYVSVDYSLQIQLGIRRAVETSGSGVSLPADIGTATTIVHAAHAAGPKPVATQIVSVERGE